jgi:hypothetical protein
MQYVYMIFSIIGLIILSGILSNLVYIRTLFKYYVNENEKELTNDK